MKYRLPVTVFPMDDGGFMARCEQVRVTATGDSSQAAIENLREAIEELVLEYGEAAVFEGVSPEGDVRVIEVAV